MNTFTAVVNVCKAPETLELGGRECVKLRLADNTFGKKSETRFFDAIVSGNDADVAMRLEQGDQIAVTGTLVSTSYKSKRGKNKGKTVQSDQMPFAKILQVTKSPSFFERSDDDEEPEEGAEDTEEPSLDDPETELDEDEDPLADVR